MAEMLQDRVAVITGASRGIGKAMALALAKEGCDIVVAAKTVEPHPKLPGTIYDTAKEVEALGRRALPIQVDVRFEEQVEAMARKTEEAFGRCDILINNAGAIFWAGVLETPVKRFDLMWQINARAPFLCSQALIPLMKKHKWGHIIMMSPPLRLDLLPGRVAYLMTKYAMTHCALGLAAELREENIACNALWPVTLIESSATINFQMGTPDQWRTPAIMCDALLAIVKKAPRAFTGNVLLDEDFLREEGVTDFDKYAKVPGASPPRWF